MECLLSCHVVVIVVSVRLFNRLNNLNIKIVSNLHAQRCVGRQQQQLQQASATSTAATILTTTATIANQIKQLSCYEHRRGNMAAHQLARLTSPRSL